MGCSNSKATEPHPGPLARNPVGDGGAALPDLDKSLACMLEEAGLAGHDGIRKALRDNHCTMGVLRTVRDNGKLKEAIADFALGVVLSARLEEAIVSALDRDPEEMRVERVSPSRGDEMARIKGAEENEAGKPNMQRMEKTERAERNHLGFIKADTIKAIVAVGDTAEAIQEARDKGDEVQEGIEENAVLVDAGRDILEALRKELGLVQALEGVRDVVPDFVAVAQGALDVIGSIPFVAPVAKLASLVVRQVAAEKATRALCKGLIPLCACAFKVLKEVDETNKGLSGCEEELGKLRAALENAREVVEAVRNRSFFRRVLTAGRDAEGIKEAGDAVDNALREVVAAAAMGAMQTADRALDEARAAVAQLKSAEEMRQLLLGKIGGEGASESEVLRKVEELGEVEWEVMWSKFSAGERIAIAKADDAHRRIDDLLMKEVASRYHPEVANLPPKLRDMWADELLYASYNSIKWAQVHDKIPKLKWCEKGLRLSDWAQERLQGRDLASFLHEIAKSSLAPDGEMWVQHLVDKSRDALFEFEVDKDNLEAAHVLDVILMESEKDAKNMDGRKDGLVALRGTLGAHDIGRDCASRAVGFMEGTRDWLLDKIMAWAREQGEEGGKRVFALMSAPGMGKTAFTARVSEMLREEGLLLAGHFIRVGDESRTDPKRVIKSLAVQVAEALRGDVADAVLSGAECVNDATTVWELAEQLVLKPLGKAGRDRDATSLVVVIDALDEGGSEKSNVLMSMLMRLVSVLPEWVKVLVTTRPEPYIKGALERHNPFTLEPGDEQNRVDLRAFIRGSLSTDLADDMREEVVRVIEGKSEGVIGYVAAVMAMVREGMGRKGGAGGAGNLAEIQLGELPTGLATLYGEYMERQFRHVGDGERRAVRERMLPALAVAEEPLLVRDVERLVKHGGGRGTEVSDEAVGRVVQAAGSLFPVAEDGRMRPFHKSVLDWLMDESSGDWHVDDEAGHAVHAHTWGQMALEVGLGVKDGESLRLVGEYGGKHALMHAARSGDAALAHRLCTTLQLIRAGVEAGAAGLLVRGAALCYDLASSAGVSDTYKWLREFAPELAVSRGYTVEAAQLAPSETWMRMLALKIKKTWYQGPLPIKTPTMSYIPDDVILKGHTAKVTQAKLSGDGAMVVTASDDCTARIWDAMTGELKHTLEGHKSSVTDVAVCEGGATVVTASDDKTARIWDANTGDMRHTLEGHRKGLFRLAVCEDGATVVTASFDKTARIWDARTGTLRHTLEGHTRLVTHVAICEDGATIVTSSEDKTARIWDARRGALRHTLEGHTDGVDHVAICEDGATVVTASNDCTARIWDARTGELRHTLKGHQGWVNHVVICADGETVVTASLDGTTKIWDARTGELRHTLKGHRSWVCEVVVCEDGETVVTASDDKTARIWDARTGALRHTLEGHTAGVNHVATCEAGVTVATASDDSTARIWDTRTGNLRYTLLVEGHTNSVTDVVFCGDGATVVTTSRDNTAMLWDARTGELRHVLKGHTSYLTGVAVCEDGMTVVTASDDCTARIWDAMTGELKNTLEGHTGAVTHVSVHMDRVTVVTASKDATARIWDGRTGELRHALEGHTACVNHIAICEDGATVVTASRDMTARIWDARTGELRYTLEGHVNWVIHVAICEDGATVVTASNDCTARIWDAWTGELKHTLKGHTKWLNHVAIYEGGATVVTASDDHTARIWDAMTGELRHALEGIRGPVNYVAACSDYALLLSCCADKTIRVWSMGTGHLIAALATWFHPMSVSLRICKSPKKDGMHVGCLSAAGRHAVVDRTVGALHASVPLGRCTGTESAPNVQQLPAGVVSLVEKASCRFVGGCFAVDCTATAL